MPAYSADDLALAALLRIVPTGYRLIDVSDTRFPGVREKFTRLALRHLGPHPTLVGFCGPDQDPREAALAAARWAAENLRPTAIQRRVDPAVLVVALEPPPGVEGGSVPGAPARSTIWTVRGGRLASPARPRGVPPARLVRDAAASLERGEPPPSIGTIDVAERTLMVGRPRGRRLSLGGGAGIVIVIAALLALRYLPVLLPRPPGVAPGNQCPPAGCTALGPQDNGRVVQVTQGALVTVTVPLAGGTPAGCFTDSDPAVLQLRQCTTVEGGSPALVALYTAAGPGSATLSLEGYSVTLVVR